MEITPQQIIVRAAFTALGLLGISACSSSGPVATHEIVRCGGVTEVDVPPGSLEEISVPGLSLEYIVNADGTVTYYSEPRFTDDIPSIRRVGDLEKNHLGVILQGDTDGDGSQNVVFESICPVPAPKQTPGLR